MYAYTLERADNSFANPQPVETYQGADALLFRVNGTKANFERVGEMLDEYNVPYHTALNDDGEIAVVVEGLLPSFYVNLKIKLREAVTPRHCTVDRKQLLDAIGIVKRAIGRHSTLPILHRLLFVYERGTLAISATDLEVGVTVKMMADGPGEFATTVEPKTVEQLLKVDESDTVTIELAFNEHGCDEFRMYGDGDTKLATLPADEFPPLPHINNWIGYCDPWDAVERVIVSRSEDQTRARLTGVKVIAEDGNWKFVCTNTHTMSLEDVPGFTIGYDQIVAGRFWDVCLGIMGKKNRETASFYGNDTQFAVVFDIGELSVFVVTEVVEGEFPNHKRVIPTDNKVWVTVKRDELTKALKALDVIASHNNRKVVWNLTDNLDLEASSSKIGSTTRTVKCEYESGDRRNKDWRDLTDMRQIALCCDYTIDLIAKLGDTLRIGLSASNVPILITDGRTTNIQMPMQLV